MNARFSGFLTAIALAALIPSAAFAHHCKGPHAGDPSCDSGGGGGGGGGDDSGSPTYLISVDSHASLEPVSTPYDPPEDCLGTNPNASEPVFWVDMPKHECSTLVTSQGYLLTDDIRIRVNRDGNGDLVSVEVTGQDIIGKKGLVHTSGAIAITPQTPNLTGDFTLHVDADNVTIWKCNTHTLKPNTRCDVPVGTVSLGDFTYVLQ